PEPIVRLRNQKVGLLSIRVPAKRDENAASQPFPSVSSSAVLLDEKKDDVALCRRACAQNAKPASREAFVDRGATIWSLKVASRLFHAKNLARIRVSSC